VLSLKPVRRVFRPLIEPRARWLLRPEPSTATGTIVLPPEALPPGARPPASEAQRPPEDPRPGA
jgi:hypothetical protein